MTVKCTGYSSLALTDPHVWDERCYVLGGHIRSFAYAGFEASTRGLADHDKPFPLGADEVGIGGRCYVETPTTRKALVFDWAYSSYGQWRSDLCTAVLHVDPSVVWHNPDRFRDQPFYELVNFADNEGTIGPAAAADLLVDFRTHRNLVPAGSDDEFLAAATVDRWIRALTLAADGGLIKFA